jgi:dihydroorotate dehydrogenase electron transfer subunit
VEARDVNALTRVIRLDVSLDALPGQFAMLWLPGLDEKPFSLMDGAPATFLIRAVGPFSRAMCRLQARDEVWLRGPFGRPFQPRGSDHLLVGGGYGVAPLLFLARRLVGRGGAVRAVVGARTAEDVLLVEPLREAGATVEVTTEDGTRGAIGLATGAAERMARERPPDALYACGPHGMLVTLRDLGRALKVPAQLSWEAYMRCAVGICGSCEHEGRLLCADGPVLEEPA